MDNTTRRRGRRRRESLFRRWAPAVAAAVVGPAVLLVGTNGLSAGESEASCPGGTRVVDVIVAPEILPAAREVARRLDHGDGAVCRRTRVSGEAPASVALRLHEGAARPDVWVPDSSIWLHRAAVPGARLVGERPNVAYSPVVLAVRREGAGRPAGAGRQGLDAVLASRDGTPRARLGLPAPDRSAVTVGALVALQAAVSNRPDARSALAATLRGTDASLPAVPGQLLAAAASTDEPVAVAATEQSVFAHNAGAGPARHLRALYPASGRFAMDYPVIAMSRQRAVGAEAHRLLGGLQSPWGRRLLQAAGLRDGTGEAGSALRAAVGVDPDAPAIAGRTEPAAVEDALRVFLAVTRSFRMLAVIDVSGSMGQLVPGAAGATRIDLARSAAARALPLFPPDSHMGLWEFSTDLAPGRDYREVVPIGPVTGGDGPADGREAMALALAGLRHIDDGGTGLYDTTLAAVREVRAGWDPDRVNSVVLLTDGRNDEVTGLDLEQLVMLLREEDDPHRPVPVVSIVYGPDGDAAALQAISDATGGSAYFAHDPRRIGEILLDAIGRRPCRPDC